MRDASASATTRGSINRRAFLTGASGIFVAGCANVNLGRSFTDFFGLTDEGVVDAHCHIFNSDDLAIEGFVERVILPEYGKLGKWVADALDWALQKSAPGFQKESDLLDRLLSGDSFVEFEALESEAELLDGYLNQRRESDPDLYEEMYEEVNGTPRPEGFVDPEAENAQFIDTVVARALRWGRLITRYRVEIAQTLLDTYPNVDLFTPALVDMDMWLDDRAKVRLSDQLRLQSKIARWSHGRIHPFMAYDPLREAMSEDDPLSGSLRWVATAVEEYGAVGVKLYPPMGFRPADNSSKAEAGELEQAIDVALDAFYSWCVENDVPVQAHCNRSNEASPGAKDGANPKYWRLVLERHPMLRLNLSHFGGTEAIARDVENSWAHEIASLMQDYDHVYADFGFHDIALDADDDEIERFFEGLRWLHGQFSALGDRSIYGSDWQMIMIKKNHEDYLETYSKLMKDYLGSDVSRSFRGENAMRYLGLDGQDSGNRRRLAAFYQAHGMALPRWWRS